MPIVQLSTGEKVHIKDRFTHKMHRELFKALNRGVNWKQDAETGEFTKELPAENIELQYEAVMPLVIEKIEKGGATVAFSPDWLDELDQPDYRRIEEAIAAVRVGPTAQSESGEKKA